MKTWFARLTPALLVLSLMGAGAARAQGAAPPAPPEAARPPEAPVSPPDAPQARVRSSHTVDVIAPGEKVDTILGRMKVERPPPPPRASDAVRPPQGPESRGPAGGPGPEGGRPNAPRPPGGEGNMRGPSPRTDGARPPSGQQPPSTPPSQPPRR
ncbi:hypothetical protein [Stigmatella erecta]|uniref:Translation initiation factor IF-2 n=1 Tax=Stigmatella erecta TaxID=83460 RepID=A0A1I0EVU2_9BACT|nr:hypothetical protein [Stigmatella erecta]SET49599.1 hypothetical protein SAMN05443639_103153 [Stigmatella erecta]